ncbi:MAG: hypothetical protein QJR06_10885 [Alicyclobacillaceae bacterium]|nr:hypothetical protein [Alicyclobacillaceae bacterium]
MEVVLRPELRTSGGECLGIFVDERWVGDAYLIYRTGDLMTGTIQLDSGKLEERQVSRVVRQVRDYIAGVAGALNIDEASVVMMYGDVDPVLEGPETAVGVQGKEPQEEGRSEIPDGPAEWREGAGDGETRRFHGAEEEGSPTGANGAAESPAGSPRVEGARRRQKNLLHRGRSPVHLSLHKEEGNPLRYRIRDGRYRTVGMVAVNASDRSVTGRVEFWRNPGKAITNEVARLLAREFADGEVDRVKFTMSYQDKHLGDMHLEKYPSQ